MEDFIPLSVPNLKGNELEYVKDAIEQEWVSTAGTYVNRFEQEIAKYLNVESAAALQSGTAGLHLAMVMCDVGSDNEVIVPTLTFIAAVNPVKYVDASPVFMDCDDSLCMDMDKLSKFCENECDMVDGKLINRKTKKHIKAVIVVHIFGNMADMQKAVEICDRYNLILIEDATEALGTVYKSGAYKGKYAGTIGDIGVYSFNGNKIITTGGGGMLVSKHGELVKRAKYLSTQAKNDEARFIHNEVGYNYRMTNIQAAMGVAQLEQLESFIEIKKNNYCLFKRNGLNLLDFSENIRPNYWFYSLLTEERDKMIDYFKKNNVQVRPIWGLINEQAPYLNEQCYKIDKAKYYFSKVLNIPCSSSLTEIDVSRVSAVVNNYLNR